MEEADDESAGQACILCDGHSTKWYSLRSWIRIATIRSILKEHVPARAQEFESSSGFICARCYHAMDNLVRKKQEAAEAENFVQFLAKQTPTKQELDSDAETEKISERETSPPPNIAGNDKGSESGTKNASTMTQITVTQTRSGREYTKRKLPNTENTVPEKVKKAPANDCNLQASQDKLGKLTASQTQSTINPSSPTSPGASSSIDDVIDEGTKGKRGRGRPRIYPACSPSDEMSRETDDVSEKTSKKRGRGRPKKYSPGTSTPETSTHVQKVMNGTSEKRGRGRPRMYLIQAPALGAAKIEIKVSSAASVKHGRGRPRKLSIDRPSSEKPSTAEEAGISTTPKRGRGRPSKLSRGGQTETLKTSSELHENSPSTSETGLLDHGQNVKQEENRDSMGQDSKEDRETLINEDSSNTRFSDTGDITSDHSYHAGSARVLGQKHVEIDQLSDVPNDSESENEDFSDDMDEDYVPDKDGHHNTSEKKSSTVTNPLDHMLGQRMTTRIRSGAIDRRVVFVGRKKEREKSILGKRYSSSMKEKSILGKRSTLRRNKNSNGSQKKLTFLNACNLQELPAKEMEKEKRVIPLHKAKKMAERKRKAKTKQFSVNPEIWSCKQCEAVEYSETDIRNHVRTEHNLSNDEEIEENFSKKIVNLITPKGMNTSVQEELLNFLKTKEVTSYTCLICELKMRTENNALTHVRMTHCKSKEDALSCIKRNIAIVSVDNQHSDSNGKPSKKTAEQRNTERRNRRRAMMCVKQKFQTKMIRWKCKICESLYVSKSSTRRHIVKQHIVNDSDIKSNIIQVLVDCNIKTTIGEEDDNSTDPIAENDAEAVKQEQNEDETQLVISERGRSKHGYNKPWRCGLCTIYYFHKCDVLRHLMLKHGFTREDAKSYVVQEKWQEASSKKFFATKVEVYTMANEDIVSEDNENVADTEDEEELDPYNKDQKPWKCIKCGKRLPTKKAALRHMRFPHEIYGPWARYHVRQIAPEQDSKTKKLEDEFHLERDILCVLCGRDYTNQVHATQHTKDCHPDLSTNMAADVLLTKSGGPKLILLSLPGEVTRSYHIDSKGKIREVDLEKSPSLKENTSVWDKKTYSFFDDEKEESDAEIIDDETDLPFVTSTEELNVTHTNMFYLSWENYQHMDDKTSNTHAQNKKQWQCHKCHKELSNKLTGIQHVAHVHNIHGPWARHFLKKTDEWDGLLEKAMLPDRDWLCVYCGRHYKTKEDASRHVTGWHSNLTVQMQKTLVLQKSGGCKSIVLTTSDRGKFTFLIDSFGRMKEVENTSTQFEKVVRKCSFNCQQEDSNIDVDDFDPQFFDTDSTLGTNQEQQKEKIKIAPSTAKRLRKQARRDAAKSLQDNDAKNNSLNTDDSNLSLTEQKVQLYMCSNPNAKKAYVCRSCPLVLSSNKQASYHRLHHKNVVRWRCRICGEAFYYISQLSEHIHNLHNQSLLSIILNTEEIVDDQPFKVTKETADQDRDMSLPGTDVPTENLTPVMSDIGSFMTSSEYSSVQVSEEKNNDITTMVQGAAAIDRVEVSSAVGNHVGYEKNSDEPVEEKKTKKKVPNKQGEKDVLDFENGESNLKQTKMGKRSCEVCGLFVPLENLESHKTLFHGIMTIRCMECNQDHTTFAALDEHILEVHKVRPDDDKRIHPCIICNSVYRNRPDLLNHLDRHKVGECLCTICGKSFDNMNTLKSHMSVHTCLYSSDKHECLVCGITLSTMKSFQKHIRNHYDEHHKVLQCEICNKILKSRTVLADHMKNHSFEAALCPYCAKKFTSRANFLRHLRFHEHPELFCCPDCGLQFSTFAGLRRHQKYHHSAGDGKSVCHICGKRLRHMKWHLKRAHSGELKVSKRPPKKSSTCNYCGKVFRQPHEMERHKVVHTGEKPFRCEVCNKSFRYKTSFKAHINIHPEYQAYKCAGCEALFREEKDLMEHKSVCPTGGIKTEFQYQCDICQRMFRAKKSFHMHIDRKHEVERHDRLPGCIQYNCPTCGRGYFYKDSLSRHRCPAKKAVQSEESLATDNVIAETTGNVIAETTDNVIDETTNIIDESQDVSHTLYKCGICERIFGELEEFKIHVSTDHDESMLGDLTATEEVPIEQGVAGVLEEGTVITLENGQAAQLFNQIQLQVGKGQELVNVIIPMTN